ncbi:MAG: UDP-N-acetylglucosamine--N-acetylmuramyl-(pentapeptide) pyrophosphoryl-undecaprenol N-acetylglucosamine transferase [Oscillospiraceae bacterium]
MTGNPVRSGFLYTTKKEARRELGLDDRMTVVSFGGSLGAERVNMAVADLIAWSVRKKQIQHIHATGRYGTELMPELLAERRVNLAQNPQVDIREYIDNMPQCFAAADLVICRAGAITLSELQIAGRAAILIPSPNVAENHQYHNAMVLVRHGAARIIEEKDLTGEKLIQMVKELLENPNKLAELSKNAAKMAIVDTNDRIYEVIRQLAGGR